MLARLRTSFLTGIVVIAPVALTLWLIWSVIGWFDGFVLPFVPDAYRPEQILNTIFGYDLKLNIRGVGVVVFLVFATLVDWQLGFQKAASETMRDIVNFHDKLLLPIIIAISVFEEFLTKMF